MKKIVVKDTEIFIKKIENRDYASGAQLICLTNLESLNSVMIKEGKTQKERIEKLNGIAIYQMTILPEDKRIEDMNLIVQEEGKS